MRIRSRGVVRVLFWPFCLFLAFLVLYASGCSRGPETVAPEAELAPVREEARGQVDFAVLIDNSRSITPAEQEIVRETTKLLLDLVDPGDGVAVIAFDTGARQVVSSIVHDDADRRRLQQIVDEELDFSGNRSDIRAGLRLLANRKEELFPNRDATRVAIVLSDGRLEPADQQTDQALAQIQADLEGPLDDVLVHAIVLGDKYCNRSIPGLSQDKVGVDLMREDVARSPDFFFHARSLDQLLDSMVFILNRAKGISSMGKEGGARFRVDDTVESIMLIVRKKTADGTQLAASSDIILNWPGSGGPRAGDLYHNQDYTYFDLFVMRRPVPGIWSVELKNGSAPQVLCKIDSPIRLLVESKSSYFENEYGILRAWLQDDTRQAPSRDPYRLRLRWSPDDDLQNSTRYVDFRRDTTSGQFFLPMPVTLQGDGPPARLPARFRFEVSAQRYAPDDSTRMDDWFLRVSPADSLEVAPPLVFWNEQPALLTTLPFRGTAQVFGGHLALADPRYGRFTVPPGLSLMIQKLDPEQGQFVAYRHTQIDGVVADGDLVFAEPMGITENGRFRYVYRLEGQTAEGSLSIRSPWLYFERRTLPGLWPGLGVLALILIHLLGQATAKVKGRLVVEVGGKMESQTIRPAKVFDSQTGFDRRVQEEDCRLAPVQFKVKPLRWLGLFKKVEIHLVAGKMKVMNQELSPGQKKRFPAGRPLKLAFPGSTDGKEGKLTAVV
jgi:hypothetical protein